MDLFRKGKTKKRRGSTGNIDAGLSSQNRSRQSTNLRRARTTDDLSSTTRDPNSDPRRTDTTTTVDTQSTVAKGKGRSRSASDSGVNSRVRRQQDDESSGQDRVRRQRSDSAVTTVVTQQIDGGSPQDEQEQRQLMKMWVEQFEQGRLALPQVKVPSRIRTGTELQISIRDFERDSVKTSNDYKFGNVDKFLKTFNPTKQPQIYIMEGAYPDPQKTQDRRLGDELAKAVPINADRSLHRSGSDNPNHGITVGSLVKHNYPEASVSLKVALGHPAQDFGVQDITKLPVVAQEFLSTATKNTSFQSFFDKLESENVADSVINLSQMVTPKEELSEETVNKMKDLARKNNVLVLAMGNQGAKSDATPAYQRLHAAIEEISNDPSIPGTIVIVENLQRTETAGTATLVSTSNYIADPNKKGTTLALKGESPEVGDKHAGVGHGTSYAAPKLSAMISKLTTAATIIKGRTVKGKDVVAALVELADKYQVRKTSKTRDDGEEITDPAQQVQDTFQINVPNGDKALKLLLKKI